MQEAIKWFPLTPDFIDKYLEGVLSYIQEVDEVIDQVLSNDSFRTTTNLLYQRAEQILAEYSAYAVCDFTEDKKAKLTSDTRITAAALYLHMRLSDADVTSLVGALSYMLSVSCPTISKDLVSFYLKILSSDRITALGYKVADIIDFDALQFSAKLLESTVMEGDTVKWVDCHGTARISKDGIVLYDCNRFFAQLRSIPSRTHDFFDGRISIARKKNEPFSRFLSEMAESKQYDDANNSKKTYSDGDELTVRILDMTDGIKVESIDPEYETVTGYISFGFDDDGYEYNNVKGYYLDDFRGVLYVGGYINVEYLAEYNSFCVYESFMNYIYNTFSNTYPFEVNAKLLYPHNALPNTWFTEKGFLVVTDYKNVQPSSYCRIRVTDYNPDYDMFVGEIVSDSALPVYVQNIKSNLLIKFLSSQKTIMSAPTLRKQVKYLNASCISFLHRLIYSSANVSEWRSQVRAQELELETALATLVGDYRDLHLYAYSAEYLKRLVAFAEKKFDCLTDIDPFDDIDDLPVIREMSNVLDVLSEIKRKEVSNFLTEIIKNPDYETITRSIARLVQSLKTISGTKSLAKLEADIHKEICDQLSITDAIPKEDSTVYSGLNLPQENDHLEYKMSFVRDYDGRVNPTSQGVSVCETICGFLNHYVEDGESHVYIGVDEKRDRINGVASDIQDLHLTGAKSSPELEYQQYVQQFIKNKFPDDFDHIHVSYSFNGEHRDDVLDIMVEPSYHIVRLDGSVYVRWGDNDRKIVSEQIVQERSDRKALTRSVMFDKIETLKKAFALEQTVMLQGYDSSNSNTSGVGRKVEAHAFTDNNRCDGVWAYDPKDGKNKVFLLKRASGVEILPEKWKYKSKHATYELDVFGFYGTDKVQNINIVLKTVKAKNIMVELYPNSSRMLLEIDTPQGKQWRLIAPLKNKLSLDAAVSFYLSLPDDVDISQSQELKEKVLEKLMWIESSLK